MKNQSLLSANFNSVVLWANKSYSLEFVPSNGEFCLIGVKSDRCNWIIRYDSGKIAYDNYVCDYLHSIVLRKITKFHALQSVA